MAWYSTGTVAVTANSPTVTGTGTQFSSNARVGDAFRGPDGRWYEVTNVASSTVISIKPNYQGNTASGQAYAVAPILGYDKELSDRFNLIANQWGATLAGIKPWALSANAAAAREDLGLGSAAVREALGSSGALYSRDSILGAVSQSSGVPTGAVIQRGSNANGEFVRFADGTQICAGVSSTALVCSVATGGGFQSSNVAALYFPAAFSAAPSVSPVPAFREGATSRAWLSMNPPSASVVTLISHGFVDRAEVMPGYIAFGRWY
ncbi:TPA: hypothetical protein L6A17_07055 [Pseudomonas aeruginosa]|nr:hypothetical protein [Pseudomonas aeruginosa]HBP6146857.1 hypothetical protein [Pseudomonas aeruginosa]HBP6152936.1 hypothetical protein [Pseudomonas aeruginosa]HBP6368308.1 hypothetical protein [Pseudomonas aeruginosa]HBP6635308.1 hypothetical protein [Pseudomonas aeruginosa]